jgi:uncharacterized protein YidB (DUF937 family)
MLAVLSDPGDPSRHPQYLLDALRDAGYGVVVNSWVDTETVAVVVYKEGVMVGNGEGVLLADALRHACVQLGVV